MVLSSAMTLDRSPAHRLIRHDAVSMLRTRGGDGVPSADGAIPNGPFWCIASPGSLDDVQRSMAGMTNGWLRGFDSHRDGLPSPNQKILLVDTTHFSLERLSVNHAGRSLPTS